MQLCLNVTMELARGGSKFHGCGEHGLRNRIPSRALDHNIWYNMPVSPACEALASKQEALPRKTVRGSCLIDKDGFNGMFGGFV